tara:strand:+ start:37498 stop:37944 length:447 start_codon:yes stop_codon:yes gene_type:complete
VQKMKIFYGLVLVLMLFMSACAQQPAAQPEPQVQPEEEAAEEVVEEEVVEETEAAAEEEVVTPATGNEVRILGVGQYDPEDVTISAGESITFFNEGNIRTVVTIKSSSGTTNTPLIDVGGKYEQEFSEAGEYDAWGVSYGPGVKITVE